MSFSAASFLKSPHLQTVFPLLLKADKTSYLSEDFILEDGDFTEISWSEDPKEKDYKNICVLFHGLGGSIDSHYIQGMMRSLDSLGYLCVLMHFRGCGLKPNTKIRSYHAGETEDARFFINHLSQRFPDSNIHAIGYSLGANMLLKLLGSYKDSTPLRSAVAVSAPLELEPCTLHINKGVAKIYQKYLLHSLKAALLLKASKIDIKAKLNLSIKNIKNIKSIYEFDEVYTAPVHGYESASDYYQQNSAKQFLKDIQTPTLMIHAKDDPFMPASILPQEKELSKKIILEVSNKGGHVGFISGSALKPNFWLESRVQQFFKNQSQT